MVRSAQSLFYTDRSGNRAFWNATRCITYQLQKTITCKKTKGNKNLFPGFQSMVSFGWPFEIGSERVGNILNWVTRKSIAWLDLGFRESVEQVVIEVKISVTPSIYSGTSINTCLVPVRRLFRPLRSMHFGDVSETNGRETPRQSRSVHACIFEKFPRSTEIIYK